ALELLAAGADLVEIDSGLVFGGPGLPKRCNEAVLAGRAEPPRPPERPAEMSWFWALLMGAAMLGGGLLALAIAATRGVLPHGDALPGAALVPGGQARAAAGAAAGPARGPGVAAEPVGAVALRRPRRRAADGRVRHLGHRQHPGVRAGRPDVHGHDARGAGGG